MTERADEPTPRKPLRLWPGVVAAVLLVLVRIGLPIVAPQNTIYGVLGALVFAVVILVWWLLFSRAPWSERLGAVVLMIVALAATSLVLHESIRGGMMGNMPWLYGMPVLCVALVAWAVASRGLSAGPRRALLVAAIVFACGALTLVRTSGVSGEGNTDLHWRWTPTPEERLLARAADDPAVALPPAPKPLETPGKEVPAPATETPTAPAAAPEKRVAARTGDEPAARGAAPSDAKAPAAEWPGFRGPARDGVIRGVRIATDWVKSPPVELWRRPVGPGWSSFAVDGSRIFTQEQRGDEEIVSCYDLTTGQPVWSHRDAARFYESNGGAGPRATPTFGKGRVYTLGATGILNALDARTGAVVWARNAASDTGAKNPGWGFAGSPLVVGDLVIVATSGRLAAYDAATGDPRWQGPTGGAGYSSPHLVTIDGVPQVLLLRGARTTSVAPADGTLLWEHVAEPGVSIVQPGLAADGNILIAAGDGMGGQGIRRIAVARGPAGWTLAERWTSRGLKPYFNDFVVHEGHAFGFDGSILAAIDLADGQRKWKGGRYGHGQMILLPDQDLLLVLSEDGELALVGAAPAQHTELARFKAIEGKTWNHPVLVGDVLLVRNGEEMAAFRLPVAAS